MTDLDIPRFVKESSARELLEGIRWPYGPVCPHCGSTNNASRISGESARPGLWHCKECRRQFTVTVGTWLEHTRIPLNKWVLAVHLMLATPDGVSVHQLRAMLGVTYQTTRFMARRIREAMRETRLPSIGVQGNG